MFVSASVYNGEENSRWTQFSLQLSVDTTALSVALSRFSLQTQESPSVVLDSESFLQGISVTLKLNLAFPQDDRKYSQRVLVNTL